MNFWAKYFTFLSVLLLTIISFIRPVFGLAIILIGLSIILILLIMFFVFKLYENNYFNSDKFKRKKDEIFQYIKDCADLGNYIDEIKNRYQDVFSLNKFGFAETNEDSRYNYKRVNLTKDRLNNHTYNCSLNIVKKAEESPFIYVCKYFNIDKDEETFENIQQMLNDFISINEGMIINQKQRNKIYDDLEIPFLLRKFSTKRIISELGLPDTKFNVDYYPKVVFKYVSAGGNSSRSTTVTFDIHNTEQFLSFLSSNIKKQKESKFQRQLMTPKLRESIKQRDNYTCQECGVSLQDEPHLLLEIDHIIPVAKGGLTTKDNLQTLCWKCNRKKSVQMPHLKQ